MRTQRRQRRARRSRPAARGQRLSARYGCRVL